MFVLTRRCDHSNQIKSRGLFGFGPIHQLITRQICEIKTQDTKRPRLFDRAPVLSITSCHPKNRTSPRKIIAHLHSSWHSPWRLIILARHGCFSVSFGWVLFLLRSLSLVIVWLRCQPTAALKPVSSKIPLISCSRCVMPQLPNLEALSYSESGSW